MTSPSATTRSQAIAAPRRPAVYITGIGAVTGFGWGADTLFDGFASGESAVQANSNYPNLNDGEPIFVSQIPDGGDPADGFTKYTRAVRSVIREAVTDARARGWEPGHAVGVVHALVLGDVETWATYYRSGEDQPSGRRWATMMPSTVIALAMNEFGFTGPAMAVSAMCASGNAALLTAKSWINSGVCSDVLVVATDISGDPQSIAGFVNLGVATIDTPALDASRPFQEGSRGFVQGEASVAMMISGESTGAYSTVLGGAMTNDGFHAVSIEPSYTQLFRAVTEALEDAGVSAEEIAYLNAHGPGTAQCDAAEGQILDQLLPEAHGVFAVKPIVGHCQGAASAVETMATLYAFETDVIPATPHVAAAHPRLLDGHTPRRPGLILKSSIGIGGHNSMVVHAKPGE